MKRQRVTRAPRQQAEAPTPEAMRRAPYVAFDITEAGQVTGRRYERLPYYLTLGPQRDKDGRWRAGKLTRDHVDALRYYRFCVTRAGRGLIPGALAIDVRGGGVGYCPSESKLIAGEWLDGIDRQIPDPYLATLRAVGIEDKSIAEHARELFAVAHHRRPSGHQQRVALGRFVVGCDVLWNVVCRHITTMR